MTDLTPWLVLAGLGAFHGINPAMGWLFAVALGLHRDSRSVVAVALIPIAIGHALSITLVALVVAISGWCSTSSCCSSRPVQRSSAGPYGTGSTVIATG